MAVAPPRGSVLRPSPTRDSPASIRLLHRERPHTLLRHLLAFELVGVVRRIDRIGAVARNGDVPRLAACDHLIRDPSVLVLRGERCSPVGTGIRALPGMRCEIVDDYRAVRAQ